MRRSFHTGLVNQYRRQHSWRAKRQSDICGHPYTNRVALLSQGELAFFRALRSAIAPWHCISLKMRLADVIRCPNHLWDKAPGRRLSQKHIDFVLYDFETTRLVAAIELDDATHNAPERQARDRFVDQAMKAANTPLIRVRAAARYSVTVLRKTIMNALQVRAARPSRACRHPRSLSSSGRSPRV